MSMRRSSVYHVGIFVLLLVATAGGTDAAWARAMASPPLDGNTHVEPAAGMFLVARRSMRGPYFRRSVVYLLEHGKRGTMGLIVNRPSKVTLSDGVANIGDLSGKDHQLYLGGPVGRTQVLMLLRNPPNLVRVEHVVDDVYVSGARDVLEKLLELDKPDSELRFYVGHSGWAEGQLDFELTRKSWHVIHGDTGVIFSEDTESLWERLIDKLEPTGIFVNRSLEHPMFVELMRSALAVDRLYPSDFVP